MKSVIDYLAELSPEQSERLLETVCNDKVTMQVKLGGDDKVIHIQLQKAEVENQFALSGRCFSLSHLATFKLELGTDVYFFKTEIFQENKKNVIQKPFSVFRLVRRKESRFKIPASWQQQALILPSEKRRVASRANVRDISISGIQLHSMSDLLRFEKDELIKMQFRLHRKSEMSVAGIIRHIRKNSQGGFNLGIEFIKNTPLVKGKLDSICEDLGFHYTHLSRTTHK